MAYVDLTVFAVMIMFLAGDALACRASSLKIRLIGLMAVNQNSASLATIQMSLALSYLLMLNSMAQISSSIRMLPFNFVKNSA